jgi:hypothetical protein
MTKLQRATRALIDRHGGLRAAAKATGLDPGYLSHLRHGKKSNPGEDVLRILGLKRSVIYHTADDQPSA